MNTALIVTVSALLTNLPGQSVVRYTCDTFPEEAGFTRDGTLDTERWIEDGWLVQNVRRYGEGPHNGEKDSYRRDLADFAGVPTFFCEWTVVTDGPRSNLIGTAPAGMSLFGRSGVNYHLTIARDQMRFIRHLRWPTLYFDFEPGVPHTHRVELFGEHWYSYLIDGKVRDAGRPDGPYPTADSQMVWWGRYYLDEHVTRWDCLEFGEMPDPGIDCDSIKRLRAKCQNGKVKGKIRTELVPGTALRVTNSGDRRTIQVGDNGKAKFRYRRQSGDRTILLLDCPAISQDVSCDP